MTKQLDAMKIAILVDDLFEQAELAERLRGTCTKEARAMPRREERAQIGAGWRSARALAAVDRL
jgi:hypothetical protein